MLYGSHTFCQHEKRRQAELSNCFEAARIAGWQRVQAIHRDGCPLAYVGSKVLKLDRVAHLRECGFEAVPLLDLFRQRRALLVLAVDQDHAWPGLRHGPEPGE
jgi:hypothetical protein